MRTIKSKIKSPKEVENNIIKQLKTQKRLLGAIYEQAQVAKTMYIKTVKDDGSYL